MGWFGEIGRERPWLQGCIIAAAGVVLSLGTCFGLLFTTNLNTGNSSFGETFGYIMIGLMCLFALAVPAGGIWFIVGLVQNASRKGPGTGGASPPAPPPPPPSAPTPPAG